MAETVLLIDFENVGKIDLGAIPDGVRVPFFIGASQKTVAKDLFKAALKPGHRFEAVDIQGQGKNALDFHIAFYLGEHLARSPGSCCIVLSKDKGFDPLIKHAVGRGFTLRRATSLEEAFPHAARPAASGAAPSAYWDAALKLLSEMQKNKRPKKRKGLIAYLQTHFAKKMTEPEVFALVDRMIASKKLADLGGSMTYHLE
jgi:PIN domain-containing protein